MEPIQIAFKISGKRSYWRPEPENLKVDVDKERVNQFTKTVGNVFTGDNELALPAIKGAKYIQKRNTSTKKRAPRAHKKTDADKTKEPKAIGENGFICSPTQIEKKSPEFIGDRFRKYASDQAMDEQRRDFFIANMLLLKEVNGLLIEEKIEKHLYTGPLTQLFRAHKWSALMCETLDWLISFFSPWDRPTLLKRLKGMRAKLKTAMLRLNKAEKARKEAQKDATDENSESELDAREGPEPDVLALL